MSTCGIAIVVASAAVLRAPNVWLRYARQPHPLALKQALTEIAANTAGGSMATEADRAEAATLIAMLERAPQQLGSWAERGPHIAGVWDQVYTDNANAGTVAGNGRGSRRKLVGPISGRVAQVVRHRAPSTFEYAQRVRAPLALGLQAEMRASVEANSDGATWSVRFEDFGWSLLGGRLPLKRKKLPPGGGGEWRTTYLDHDTRILRAQSSRGGPPVTYLLLKRGA